MFLHISDAENNSLRLYLYCHSRILHTDAWLSLEIQLRRLSNGEPHPSAPKPAALSHSLDTSVARVSFAIQICANYLGVLFVSGGEGDNELVVWDWKTGAVHLVSWKC